MPRKKASQPAAQPAPESPASSDKKWAEPYRPILSNPEAGIELGENKLTNQMVFYFSKDPGSEVKDNLKHYGYRYHTEQKAWTVNATPVTREIARRLAGDFVAAKGTGQDSAAR